MGGGAALNQDSLRCWVVWNIYSAVFQAAIFVCGCKGKNKTKVRFDAKYGLFL